MFVQPISITQLPITGAYNVLNHAKFAAPNTTVTNTAFGTINAQTNRTRTIQPGARFIF